MFVVRFCCCCQALSEERRRYCHLLGNICTIVRNDASHHSKVSACVKTFGDVMSVMVFTLWLSTTLTAPYEMFQTRAIFYNMYNSNNPALTYVTWSPFFTKIRLKRTLL